MDHAAVLPPDVNERPVLVIGPGVNYSLERFPQLGGVLCCGAEPAGKEEPEGPLPGQKTVVAGQEELLREHAVFQPVINGRNAEEKRNILARLKTYRSAHGLGCLSRVAEEAGSPITEDLLRDMLVGAASPNIAQWRQVNEALATLEAWEAVSGDQ